MNHKIKYITLTIIIIVLLGICSSIDKISEIYESIQYKSMSEEKTEVFNLFKEDNSNDIEIIDVTYNQTNKHATFILGLDENEQSIFYRSFFYMTKLLNCLFEEEIKTMSSANSCEFIIKKDNALVGEFEFDKDSFDKLKDIYLTGLDLDKYASKINLEGIYSSIYSDYIKQSAFERGYDHDNWWNETRNEYRKSRGLN